MASSALALDGKPRNEWVGRDQKETKLASKTGSAVYIFATPDCGSCASQLALLSSFQSLNPKLKVFIVTQSNDEKFKEFTSGFNLKFNVIEDKSGEVVTGFGVSMLPSIIFSDNNNKLAGFYEGQLSKAELFELSAQLIANKPLTKITIPGAVGSEAPAIKNVIWSQNKNNLIIFHSSTCHYCSLELPHLIAFAKENANVKVYVVATDDYDAVKKQFDGASENIVIVGEPGSSSLGQSIGNAYRISGTPTQVLVNEDGVITWRGEGFDVETANIFKKDALPLR